MTTYKQAFLFWKGVGMVILLSHVSAWAADSPLTVIRSSVERVGAILQDPAYQGKDHRRERLAQVREIVLPWFATEEIAKRALGVHWRNRTEDEKREFTRLFTALVEKSYSGTLDRYTSDVRFFFDRERIEDDFAEVNTRILDPSQSKTFSIDYHLHRVGGGWLIYDVVIENVSMVSNYRNQFHRVLSQSSYEDLVKSIESKLHDLDSSPS